MVKGGGTPLVLPLTICDLSAISTIGFMIRSGGSAIISKTLGEGRNEDAQKYFSLMIYFIIRVSTVIAALGAMFIRPIAGMFGVEGEVLADCILYGRIMFITLPAYILQYTWPPEVFVFMR